ncbi:MAG: hypothetical protein AAB964_01955, partial [Patescibacteria group bacterium]
MQHTIKNMSSFWVGLLLALTISFGAAYFAHAEDGQNGGADANTPQTEVATSTDGTGGQSGVGGTVITGDATASTSVDNELNTNSVSISQNCAAATSTDPTPEELCDNPGQETNSSTITASTTNQGELGSAASSSATTGANAAEGDDGLATVVTGDALATANVINVINTNLFNSEGLILFINQLFGGGLDLRAYDLSYFFRGSPGASPTTNANGNPQCTLLTCLNSSSLNVLNTNNATVTNDVIVRAGTGDNTATTSGQGTDADAEIDTGDAYAAANVINLVNTNFINSSYLLLAFNKFGDLNEDIILP